MDLWDKNKAKGTVSAGVGDPRVPRAERRHGHGIWVAAAAALSTGALCAGLLATAVPAYADVTSNYYTIGQGTLTGVVATPASVSQNASTNFEVEFTAGTYLSGAVVHPKRHRRHRGCRYGDNRGSDDRVGQRVHHRRRVPCAGVLHRRRPVEHR